MSHPVKFLLIIPHLGGGGAERVTAQLASHFDPTRFDIHLTVITQDSPGAGPLPPWVHVHRLDARRVRYAARRILKLIWQIRPAVVLSSMAHLNFLMLLLRPLLPAGTKIIVRQNTTASIASCTPLMRRMYRHLYPRADRVICQSSSMAEDLAKHFHISPMRLSILANPIDTSAIRTTVQRSKTMPDPSQVPMPLHLLVVARLAHEKGIDLLLNALAPVRTHFPQIRLTVLGTGPLDAALARLTRELAIDDIVHFKGHSDDLAAYYASTDLFVLPSRHEGMPNALLEAAAAGLPILATPCCEGVCQLLKGAPGTWLTREVSANAIAEELLKAIPVINSKASTHIRFNHKFLEPFELAPAIAAYESLVLELASEPHA